MFIETLSKMLLMKNLHKSTLHISHFFQVLLYLFTDIFIGLKQLLNSKPFEAVEAQQLS